MGKRKSDVKLKLYQALSKVNDRAFSLITIFSISACITLLDAVLNITNKFNNLVFAFSALAALVVCTILSSTTGNRALRIISATLCIFLWLFVAQLSGVFQSAVFLYSAIFYAVLFWSNINLLGVFLHKPKG